MFVRFSDVFGTNSHNGGIEASPELNGNNVQGHVMESVQMERLKM